MMQGKPQTTRMDFAPTQPMMLNPIPPHPELTSMAQMASHTQSIRQANQLAQHCQTRAVDSALQLWKTTGVMHR